MSGPNGEVCAIKNRMKQIARIPIIGTIHHILFFIKKRKRWANVDERVLTVFESVDSEFILGVQFSRFKMVSSVPA